MAWQNTPSSPTTSDAFLYDGEGNRVEQQGTTGGTTPTTTSTIYVGNLEECSSNGTTTTTTTYYYAGEQRIALAINGTFSYLATDALGSATLVADANGNVQATQLFAPYGSVRYSSGTMPTDYGFTGQHSDSTTGLDYYGARYYDPLAGQFTSADTVLPGDDPWSLSRYAYVAGNPLIRLDPTGHCWVVCSIVHAVKHAIKAAVKVVAVVADTTLGISSMISDVKIIFSGKTNFFQKVLAVGDLGLNAFMDVTTVVGVGEWLRAGYLGVKVAGKVGLRALGKALTHEGEDAVEHVAEHELEDVAEHGAAQEAEHGAACALSFAPSTQVSTPKGLKPISALKVAGQAKAG